MECSCSWRSVVAEWLLSEGSSPDCYFGSCGHYTSSARSQVEIYNKKALKGNPSGLERITKLLLATAEDQHCSRAETRKSEGRGLRNSNDLEALNSRSAGTEERQHRLAERATTRDAFTDHRVTIVAGVGVALNDRTDHRPVVAEIGRPTRDDVVHRGTAAPSGHADTRSRTTAQTATGYSGRVGRIDTGERPRAAEQVSIGATNLLSYRSDEQ